jgi:hypothetical protein
MARRLVVELADIVGNRPVRWIMLGSTVGRLNVDWEVAEAAAAFAARKGWVNQQGHSLILLEAGRRMLKTSRRRRRPAKKRVLLATALEAAGSGSPDRYRSCWRSESDPPFPKLGKTPVIK